MGGIHDVENKMKMMMTMVIKYICNIDANLSQDEFILQKASGSVSTF